MECDGGGGGGRGGDLCNWIMEVEEAEKSELGWSGEY